MVGLEIFMSFLSSWPCFKSMKAYKLNPIFGPIFKKSLAFFSYWQPCLVYHI